MRRKKATIFGILSGVLCVVCVLLFLQNVQNSADAARAEALERYGGEQIEVCVSKRDIAAGETVEASALETKLWIADLLPQDAVRVPEEVVGKQASSAILAGEVVSLKRFTTTSVALDVPEGLSAVSVPARDVQAVGGAIEPGMKVDVYSTGATSTEVIAQNALVVSTNASSTDSKEAASVSWVTLAVEPKLVQSLVSAAQTTDLYFVLPNEGSGENSNKNSNNSNTSNVTTTSSKVKNLEEGEQ